MSWFSTVGWWLCVLTGCSQNIAFTVPPAETLGVSVYASGHPNAQCQVTPGSAESKKLYAWLAGNTDGWKATPATYAPGVLVSGNEFSINFQGKTVILNYSDGQYSHAIEQAQYDFLLCGNRV